MKINKRILGVTCLWGLMLVLSSCGNPISENKKTVAPSTDVNKTTVAIPNNNENVSVQAKDRAAKPSEPPMSAQLQEAVREMQSGHYEKAIQQTKSILEKKPDNYQALSVQGMAQALAGDVDTGLQSVQRSYDLNPNYVANYYNLALVYKLKGDLTKAKQWFEKVLEKDDQNIWSIYGIATIYADQGNDSEALDMLEKAINIDASIKETAKTQDHFERFHGNSRFHKLVS